MRNVKPLGYHRQTKIEPYEKHRFKFCNNDEVSLLIEEIEHTSTEFKFETGLTIQDILIFNRVPKTCSASLQSLLQQGKSWLTDLICLNLKYRLKVSLDLVTYVISVFQEIIDQRVIDAFEAELRREAGCTDVFKEASEDGRKRWTDLKSRIVEHNIRIMAKYYKKIKLSR